MGTWAIALKKRGMEPRRVGDEEEQLWRSLQAFQKHEFAVKAAMPLLVNFFASHPRSPTLNPKFQALNLKPHILNHQP